MGQGDGKKKRVRRYKGLGEARPWPSWPLATGRRRMEEDAVELPSIRSSVDLYHYFLPQMQDLFHEECYVLLMNQPAAFWIRCW